LARLPSAMRGPGHCVARQAGLGDREFSGGTSPRWFRPPG